MNQKHKQRVVIAHVVRGSFASCATILAAGCTPTEYAITGAVAGTVVGSQAPAHEIQQVYYLGVFDPLEQVPPSVYRITVRGQASFLSTTRFASGWVPASFADSLTSTASFNQDGAPSTETTTGGTLETLKLGRRMITFGPEGFLEAPANHRLVIVMGSDPSVFFGAIAEAVQKSLKIEQAGDLADVQRELMTEFIRVQSQRDRLQDLREDLAEVRP